MFWIATGNFFNDRRISTTSTLSKGQVVNAEHRPLTPLRFGTLLPETTYLKCLILVICASLPIWRRFFLFDWESANPWRNVGLVALVFRANRAPRTISLKTVGRIEGLLTNRTNKPPLTVLWLTETIDGDVRVFSQRLTKMLEEIN
jgi:hypothetical protein